MCIKLQLEKWQVLCGCNGTWLPWVPGYLDSRQWREAEMCSWYRESLWFICCCCGQKRENHRALNLERYPAFVPSFWEMGVEIHVLWAVTGSRRSSKYLPQGGLEVLCVLEFTGNIKDRTKAKWLINSLMLGRACSLNTVSCKAPLQSYRLKLLSLQQRSRRWFFSAVMTMSR